MRDPNDPTADEVAALRELLRPALAAKPSAAASVQWREAVRRRALFGASPESRPRLRGVWLWTLLAAQAAAVVLVCTLVSVPRSTVHGAILSIETTSDSKEAWMALRQLTWWDRATWTAAPKAPGEDKSARLHAVVAHRDSGRWNEWVHELTEKKVPMTVRVTPVLVEERRNLGTHLAERLLGWKNQANTEKLAEAQTLRQLQTLEPAAPPPRSSPSESGILTEVFLPEVRGVAPEAVPARWSP